jgi:hypothetical protein
VDPEDLDPDLDDWIHTGLYNSNYLFICIVEQVRYQATSTGFLPFCRQQAYICNNIPFYGTICFTLYIPTAYWYLMVMACMVRPFQALTAFTNILTTFKSTHGTTSTLMALYAILRHYKHSYGTISTLMHPYEFHKTSTLKAWNSTLTSTTSTLMASTSTHMPSTRSFTA